MMNLTEVFDCLIVLLYSIRELRIMNKYEIKTTRLDVFT